MKHECRFTTAPAGAREAVQAQRRADGKTVVRGLGAVFFDGSPGSEYEIAQDVFEHFMPSAFDNRSGVVHSMYNHSESAILGSTRSGTLKLRTDKRGLWYEVHPPDTQFVDEQILTPIRRGDVLGSSVMFVPRADGVSWRQEKRNGRTIDIREIHSVELFEVGPVWRPAYEGTTTEVGDRTYHPVRQSAEAEAVAVAVQFRWAQVQMQEERARGYRYG